MYSNASQTARDPYTSAISFNRTQLIEQVRNPVKSLITTNPPKHTQRVRFETVASIPHKANPYMFFKEKDTQTKSENKYQARPPTIVHEYNPNVAPNSYEPEIAPTKAAGSTACKDTFGKSEVKRRLQWEVEQLQKEYQTVKHTWSQQQEQKGIKSQVPKIAKREVKKELQQ